MASRRASLADNANGSDVRKSIKALDCVDLGTAVRVSTKRNSSQVLPTSPPRVASVAGAPPRERAGSRTASVNAKSSRLVSYTVNGDLVKSHGSSSQVATPTQQHKKSRHYMLGGAEGRKTGAVATSIMKIPDVPKSPTASHMRAVVCPPSFPCPPFSLSDHASSFCSPQRHIRTHRPQPTHPPSTKPSPPPPVPTPPPEPNSTKSS